MVESHAVSQRFLLRRIVAALVLLLTLLIRIDHAIREPVLNPDAIRFIEQGQALRLDPLAAIRHEVYHPLHAGLAALLHAFPVSQLVADDRLAWIVSLKIVGILCAVVVGWLIIRLSRHFGAPWWAACGAALLWAVGRRSSSYGADGLSDMLFLALFGGALLIGIRTRLHCRPLRWTLAGALAGFSYLTRPEGFAALVILGLTLILYYARFHPHLPGAALTPHKSSPPRSPWPWSNCAKSIAFLLLGFLLIGGPYMAAIGRFTGKKQILEAGPAPALASLSLSPLANHVLLEPQTWQLLGMELWETFGFAPCLVVGLAMLLKPRLWGRPHWWSLVLVWIAIWFVLMLWLIEKAGYLDGRHTLALQLALHCLFALSLPIWARPMRWWQSWWRRSSYWTRLPLWMRSRHWPAVMCAGALLLGILPGLILLAEPPAKDKLYLRDAVTWLRSHANSQSLVADNELRLGYLSGLYYHRWLGNPLAPQFDTLVPLARQHPLILAYTFQTEKGEVPTDNIGPYVAVKKFTAVGARHGDILVLYTLPDSPALSPTLSPASAATSAR